MLRTVKLTGHPVQPMLAALPVVFYATTLVAFIGYANNSNALWFRIGYLANVAGVLAAVAALIPDFIDWLAIPSERSSKRNGLKYLLLNLSALLVFGLNLFRLRGSWQAPGPSDGAAIIIPAFGLLFVSASAFVGFRPEEPRHERHSAPVPDHTDDPVGPRSVV